MKPLMPSGSSRNFPIYTHLRPLLTCCFTRDSHLLVSLISYPSVVIPNHLIRYINFCSCNYFLNNFFKWKWVRLWSVGNRQRALCRPLLLLVYQDGEGRRGSSSGGCCSPPLILHRRTNAGNCLDFSNFSPTEQKNCEVVICGKIHFAGCDWRI